MMKWLFLDQHFRVIGSNNFLCYRTNNIVIFISNVQKQTHFDNETKNEFLSPFDSIKCVQDFTITITIIIQNKK